MVELRRRNIGLLTGTFDPVHLGHVAMAEAALAQAGLDEVWFLVNPEPRHKVDVTPLEQRRAMVRLALSGHGRVREGAPAGEVVLRHRMADFESLMMAYPKYEFAFVVGSDVLAAMPNWEDYDLALRRGRFVVAQRVGEPMKEMPFSHPVRYFKLQEHRIVSSRRVLTELHRGGGCPEGMAEAVYRYIKAQSLYSL